MIILPSRAIERLGSAFYDPVPAAQFPAHRLRFRNQRWAERLGLGDLSAAAWLDHFGRFHPLPGSLERPLALRYHGHQFRTYNPDLGDGRGFLFAQLTDPLDGRLLDLGTKGSGQTPYSRAGDGRLTLKGGVREVLATEMLEALGVNTSKTFSLIETGEALERNDEPSPTRSAVLVRLSHSHIRYGSFQRLAYHEDAAAMQQLVDYCLTDLLGETASGTLDERVSRFLHRVVVGAAQLVASYMAAGFVHGVLNTDNINITGESFDYGPYRFVPRYDLSFIAAYFDHSGLYCYGRQAEALHWNVYQLAKALLLIAPKEALIPALETFPPAFEAALRAAILRRLGVAPSNDAEDLALLGAMEAALGDADLSLDRFYFDWYGGAASSARATDPIYTAPAFADLTAMLRARDPAPGVTEQLRDPYFAQAAPQSLLIDEIEAIWARIAEADDWSAFDRKIDAIRAMGAAYGNTPVLSASSPPLLR
jgi:serine/tyrosine/threonine adenylyltransferase